MLNIQLTKSRSKFDFDRKLVGVTCERIMSEQVRIPVGRLLLQVELLIKKSTLVALDHKLLLGFILRFDLLCDLLRPGEAFTAFDRSGRVVKHTLNDLTLGVGF